ncbi:MFS transporter [Methanolobus sp. ZRKC2]|uniref:MFS transporter n=1 Tax=Methanolobus sp. ZRKC2 TaxID=3125783 RepID=UPI0032460B46
MTGNHKLLIICLVAFFAMSAGALLGPVLPFMVEPLNTSRAAIGLVLGMYTFSTALFMLFISAITDSVGRKKILVPCLLINGVAGVACYFAPDFETLLALRFIQGIGISGMLPIAMTMIGELYTGLERVNAMGKMSMTTGAGAISAPMIGGALAVYGWNVPFLFYGLTIPLAIIAALFLPETNPPGNRTRNRFSDILGILRESSVLYTVFLSFAISFLLYTVVIYVPFILKDNFGFSAAEAGLALGIQGFAMVSVASQAKRLAARYGKQKVIRTGFTIIGAAIGGFIFAETLVQTLAMILLFGLGFGMVLPPLNTLATQIAPQGMMGSVVSVYNIMKYVGQTAAPLILAVVLLNFGIEAVFTASCIFAFLVAVSIYMARDIYANIAEE